MNQVGENVRRIGKEEQPRSRAGSEPPVSRLSGFLQSAGAQGEREGQPRQKQVPDEIKGSPLPGQYDARGDESCANS